ncbi:putative Zn-dependent peptidase [Anaerosolibacter carboniphilus]|uniref:Putative Zn-dependent peptidase n=1 Tax=Anaerosolibacter carboniphilus TaxID=1417629 RepID=A0A841L2B4_9FIRM|nr:pitrilysin family protein [Anaerosolibacter carboniphilus]MBB6216529.1 putative Zn-dependent peptidase [Anaerosolibacter carboniphilus]
MVERYRLSNGVRVIVEQIPHVKSVSLGFWIGVGSIHENSNNNGITHFIEHMLFKGTSNRTAKQIAESIDSIGGQLNAFTSKECTCYYAKVLDSHLPIAVDVLSDMLFNSTFSDVEIEKEKSVVLEEINMYEDSPEDLVHDLLAKVTFNNHSLGSPILGTSQTVSEFQREMLLEYIQNNYTSDNIVVSVAGNFDQELLFSLLEEKFMKYSNHIKKPNILEAPSFGKNSGHRYKDIEQLHFCIGFKGIPQGHRDLYPLLVMNNVFGGSMSSRLFQNIREDKGLAYSVFSYPSSYSQIGMMTIYAGINPSQLIEVTKLINEEICHIKEKGLTEEEFYKSKEQLKGNYILGLESTSSRMTSIGKSELLMNRVYTQKEVLEKIDAVTMEDVYRVTHDIFDSAYASVALVGKVESDNGVCEMLKF